jgi:hypothetical protein
MDSNSTELTYRLFFIGLAVDVFLPILKVEKYTRIALGALSVLLLAVAMFWSSIHPHIPTQLALSISGLVMNAWAWFVLILFTPFCLVALPLILNRQSPVSSPSPAPGQGNLIIHSAGYGLGPRQYLDVTAQVRELIKDGELHVRVHPSDLRCIDPYPGEYKHLRVIYSYGDQQKRTIDRRDLDILNLPDNMEY